MFVSFARWREETSWLNPLDHLDLKASESELRQVVVAIDGPSKADIQIETMGSGIYRVYYKCALPGERTSKDDVHFLFDLI